MTLVRGLALRISGAVVRWASPVCKEWAEGLAREVEFIEGDWPALGWAIGSLRVVLDRRVSPAADRPWPLVWWLWPCFMASQILISFGDELKASNWHDRIAWGLITFGWVAWATFDFAGWLWQRNEPPISDLQAYRMFSKAKLERRLERYRSGRRWLPLLVPVSMCTGFVLSEAGGKWGYTYTGFVIVGGAIAVWMLCLDTPTKIEARLVRVNELIAESANGSGR